MASSSPTEIESLRRQHNSLTFQLARVTREHELELCAKDKLRASIVLNRDKRYKKTGAELAAVRAMRDDGELFDIIVHSHVMDVPKHRLGGHGGYPGLPSRDFAEVADERCGNVVGLTWG